MIEIRESSENFAVELRAIAMGGQWAVTITGGKAHLGAVALGIPRPSLSDSSRMSASVSVLTVTGHRDDELARKFASVIASGLKCTTVVSCGIHFDHITPEGLLCVGRAVKQAVDAFIAQAAPGDRGIPQAT